MFEERYAVILRELHEKGRVKISELSRILGCSQMSVRNDLKRLEQDGVALRVRGGAILVSEAVRGRTDMEPVESLMTRKMRIARAGYEAIRDGDTVIIDDSSTTYFLALYIKGHPEKHLAVVTNSLPAGNELAGLKHVELYMVGGYVGDNGATVGEEAAEHMRHFHADKAFVGAHGIHFDVGITSIGTLQMDMKQAVLKASEKAYVMADSSKFRGGYLKVMCPIEAVEAIITDRSVSEEIIREAKEKGVSLMVV